MTKDLVKINLDHLFSFFPPTDLLKGEKYTVLYPSQLDANTPFIEYIQSVHYTELFSSYSIIVQFYPESVSVFSLVEGEVKTSDLLCITKYLLNQEKDVYQIQLNTVQAEAINETKFLEPFTDQLRVVTPDMILTRSTETELIMLVPPKHTLPTRVANITKIGKTKHVYSVRCISNLVFVNDILISF